MNRFKVYFDGKCKVCSREIEFYRRKPGANEIEWIDITSSNFDAVTENLDPLEVIRVFHVRDESGRLVTGVDGFIEIWKRIPSLRAWVTLSRAPGVKPILRLGYQIFIRVRPYLPRKQDDCTDGYCDRKF